jgi:hypothetical protein
VKQHILIGTYPIWSFKSFSWTLIWISKLAPEERRTIYSAIRDFHNKTCLRFFPRTIQSDYLKIIRSRESQTGSAGYPG